MMSQATIKPRKHKTPKAKAYADSVKEKIAYDLRIAREIQVGILPPDVAAVTAGTGLEAHAVLQPAQEVGGDLYEVLRTPEGNLVFVMGDVSGKGIPAALFMAVTMTLVRAMAHDSRRPEEILRRVSDALVLHNPRNMFVTLFCATYDVPTGQLTYASASPRKKVCAVLTTAGCSTRPAPAWRCRWSHRTAPTKRRSPSSPTGYRSLAAWSGLTSAPNLPRWCRAGTCW